MFWTSGLKSKSNRLGLIEGLLIFVGTVPTGSLKHCQTRTAEIRVPQALSGTVNIKVEMRYNSWRKRIQGSGSKTFTIAELRQGQSLTLTSKDDSNVSHTLTLTAVGFPAEPE